jgi:hypothetical protein
MFTRDSRPTRWDMPKTFLGWLQFVALRIGAIAAVFAYLAGPHRASIHDGSAAPRRFRP